MRTPLPRILLTNFHHRHGGGHFTYITSLCCSALRRHFDFAVASPPGSALIEFSREAGVPHIEIDFPGHLLETGGVIRSIRKLDAIYREFPFQIVHTNGSRDHWIAVYWKLLYRRAASLIRTRHAVKIIKDDLLHRIVNNRITARNIFVSFHAQKMSESNGSLRLTNAVAIPHGVDTDFFHPIPRNEEAASRYGISAGDFVFGSIAGLGPYKRVDLFIRAMSELELPRSVKIFVLGQNGPARRLTRLAEKLKVGERFIYGGYQKDVRPFVSLFDVGFVLSTSIETLSYASREMMAMGVPLISSNYSGLVENVDHDVNGILVNSANLDEIKGAIMRFVRMPADERGFYSKKAREKSERTFSLKTQMRMMQDLYGMALPCQPRLRKPPLALPGDG